MVRQNIQVENKKIIAFVQARMGSKRCPGKSMAKIQNLPVIEIVMKRLKMAKNISKIVLVTSNLKRDLKLKKYVKKLGFDCFCGSETNLVKRFLDAQKKFCNKKDQYFFRVTADNVFIDWNECDRIISSGLRKNVDFCSFINKNYSERNNDFSGELINISALKKLNTLTQNKFDLEHVYPFFFRNKKQFIVKRIEVKKKLKTKIKFDLDYKKDLVFFKKIGSKLNTDIITTNVDKIIKIGKEIC
jgi:spore coat polysaccharide biosynthesis protein SpsF